MGVARYLGEPLMATTTTHYGLRKPDPSDFVDVETDINESMDTLDAAVYAKADSSAVAGKADLVHTHAESDVTNLTTDLAGKAASVHTHAESDITNLTTDLAAKASLVGGLVTTAQLGSGSAASSPFLRGDQSWQTVSAGASIDGAGTGAVAAAHSGDTVTASGTRSIAIGRTALAGNNDNMALGAFSQANSNGNAIAIGCGDTTTSAPSAAGYGAIAIGGSSATALAGARAAGNNGIAIGAGDGGSSPGASAAGLEAVAIGFVAFWSQR